MATAREEATGLLQHYFRTAYEAGGLPWTADNDAEIATAVDYLCAEVNGSRPRYRVRTHEKNTSAEGSTC